MPDCLIQTALTRAPIQPICYINNSTHTLSNGIFGFTFLKLLKYVKKYIARKWESSNTHLHLCFPFRYYPPWLQRVKWKEVTNQWGGQLRGQNETVRRIMFNSESNISSYRSANSGVTQPGSSKIPAKPAANTKPIKVAGIGKKKTGGRQLPAPGRVKEHVAVG